MTHYKLAGGIVMTLALGLAVAAAGMPSVQALLAVRRDAVKFAAASQTLRREAAKADVMLVEATATPYPCYNGRYDGWSAEAVVDDIVDRYQTYGEIVGEPTVIRLTQVYDQDAEALGIAPEEVIYGCYPDLAVILEGDFRMEPEWVGVGGPDKGYPYVLLVIDRRHSVHLRYPSLYVQALQALLP